jgi:hypothetical protein
MRQHVRGLALNVVLHPEEVLPHLWQGRFREAEQNCVKGGQILLQTGGRLAGFAEIRCDVGLLASSAVVGSDAG